MQLKIKIMKKIIIILFTVTFFSTCKKDKTTSVACSRIKNILSEFSNGNTNTTIYEYNTDGKVKALTYKYPTSELKTEFTYESGGQLVSATSNNNPAKKDTFKLNSDGYIIYQVFQFSNGPSYHNYTYDSNGFLAAETYEAFTTGNPVSIFKLITTYTNTVINGNLIKRMAITKNAKNGTTQPPVTDTWEYDEGKPASASFNASGIGYDHIGNGFGKNSKNLPVKSIKYGDAYNYTYVIDAKGRLKEVNGIYLGSGTNNSFKNTYTYLCD
jgi:hypothetical protein